MYLLEMNNIQKSYGSLDVIKDISLKVEEGEIVSIIGPSGSGKSTLLRCATMLETVDKGEIVYLGEKAVWTEETSKGEQAVYAKKRQLKEIQKNYGLVFQNFNLLPRTSALENVIMPLGYTASHLSEKQMVERGKLMLERVGLADRMDHEPSRLSGGQQQRVAIARALVNNPRILFADEPTGNLDTKMSDEILRIFNEINASEGVTIVLVTHEMDVANSAKRIVRLVDGEISDDTVIRK